MDKRSAKAAGKAKGRASTTASRAEEDFAFSRLSYRSEGRARSPGNRFWLFEPLALFILSLILLVLLCGVQLYRMGKFDAVFGPKSATMAKGSKSWMQNGRARRIADDRLVNIDEPDIDRGPPPAPEGVVEPVKEP